MSTPRKDPAQNPRDPGTHPENEPQRKIPDLQISR
jgi:hypothetical protein